MKTWKMGAAAVMACGLMIGAGMGVGAIDAAAPAPALATAEPSKFKIDNVHSCVLFKIKHMGVSSFYGRFNKVKGDFTWDQSKPEGASINVTIDSTSIDSNNQGRDEHLKGADFFNVKEFSEITFKSKSVAKSGSDWELTGDVTMLGKTKEVKAKFVYHGEKDGGEKFGYRGGFDAMFTIKRSDFGMNYGIDKGSLSDEVGIIVGIEGVRQ